LPLTSKYLCNVIETTCAFIGGALMDETLINEGAHLKVH
jgi:hypothetical protein